jgi:mannose-1-phosphate guanylyltransferase
VSISSLNIVILAGGKGERFWPLSTAEHPKPFLKFFSERSLLQQTFDRARLLVPEERIFLVVGTQHEQISREQLPELSSDQILLEPAGRDTAAAIAYASTHLDPDSLMLVLPADHLIPDGERFAEDVTLACEYVRDHGGPCTFGITPDRAETGYGYLKAGTKQLGKDLFSVEQFVEKPDREKAEDYVRQKSYYWNSGIFLWSVRRIQELLELHLPELWRGLLERRPYESLPRTSIDFGVMQKADRVVMVRASFRWDDVGSWNALPRILPTDNDGNLIWGSPALTESSNCIVYAESHKMIVAGIRDLVIVQRGNQILICHKSYSDRLKELLAKLPT